MSNKISPLKSMLRLALTTSANHFQFYHKAAMSVETPQVQALLNVLAESEEALMERIEDMIATGVVDEIEEVMAATDREMPDETPFDLLRNDTDPRIFVCNKALQQELNGYGFYLSIAARAKSEVISRVFEYFAYEKSKQIERIRRVCDSF